MMIHSTCRAPHDVTQLPVPHLRTERFMFTSASTSGSTGFTCGADVLFYSIKTDILKTACSSHHGLQLTL